MKRITPITLFLLLIGLADVKLAQYNQTQRQPQPPQRETQPQAQAARREDRELAQRELRDRIARDERRECEVQIERAETYYISRTESGIRGRARVTTNRAASRDVRFEGVIDIRRNIINNLRWEYDTGAGYGNPGGNYGGSQSGALRSGRYEIQLVATSRLLSVGGDGRTVVQSSRGGRFSQWDIEDAGNGYYYIRAADTGDVLAAQGRGESGDSVVLVRQRRGDETQLWLVKPGPDNGYYFTTARGKSLDSPSSARQDGGRIQIYNSNGEANQRFRLRLISESNYGGNDRSRDRDRDRYDRDRDSGQSGGTGVLTWRGRVDDVIMLEIRDRSVRDRVVSGRQAESVRFDFSASLPSREVSVLVDKRRGRGEVRVVEQPSRRNNYTAVIQIRDSSGGADDYEIEVRWN
jgi:hypothetical protein